MASSASKKILSRGRELLAYDNYTRCLLLPFPFSGIATEFGDHWLQSTTATSVTGDDMTQLTVRDAADRVGVTRQTIFKAIKQGKLSATIDVRGLKQIDVSELLRVYGRLQPPGDNRGDIPDKGRLSSLSQATAALQLELERAKMLLQVKDVELAAMRERVDDLKVREQDAKAREREAVEERLRMLGVIEQQNRLLAAPVPPAATKAVVRSRSAAKATSKAAPTSTRATKKPPAIPKSPAIKAGVVIAKTTKKSPRNDID